MTERSRYLKENWTPYPKAPQGTRSVAQVASHPLWWGGEVVTVDPSGMVLQAQGITRQWNPSSMALEGWSGFAWDVLTSGDKVAVQEDGDRLLIQLLAPRIDEMTRPRYQPSVAKAWGRFLQIVRDHWLNQGFIEVATPSLVVCPGFEPTLDPIAVGKRFLPTSPEIHLKKILAAGWSEVFEIRSCFRDGEFSPHHQPEFTMLEWYRSYVGPEALTQDLRELLKSLRESGAIQGSIGECETYSVAELFRLATDFSLTPETSWGDLQSLCQALGIDHVPTDSWSDLFHRLWIERIDPWLAERAGPVFVTSFPSEQAALARIGPDGWAERVEMYWKGLEIANGFHELNDPEEQRLRALQDLGGRKAAGRAVVPMDDDFIRALRAGLAPAAGMALGLERLFMAAQGISDIRQLKAFPYER